MLPAEGAQGGTEFSVDDQGLQAAGEGQDGRMGPVGRQGQHLGRAGQFLLPEAQQPVERLAAENLVLPGSVVRVLHG